MYLTRTVGFKSRQIISWILFGIIYYDLFITITAEAEETEDKLIRLHLKYRAPFSFLKTDLVTAFSRYKTYDELMDFVATAPNHDRIFYNVTSAGTTFEGRDIPLLKISSDPKAGKPAILIDAGTHAREWASIATLTFLIKTLKEGSALLRDVDWYIIPIVNPDGYAYSMTPGNRNWRKNRSPSEGTECFGVDLNRNFGFHWSESGTSDDPCHPETYPGPAPFSEKETQAVRDVMINHQNKIKAYFTLHCFGQYIVYPYGYAAKTYAANWEELEKMGKRMAAGIRSSTRNIYTVQGSGDWYPAAGASDDFAHGVMNTTVVFTVELTKDSTGFQYPEAKLPIVFREILEIVSIAAKETSNKYTDSYFLANALI